MSRKCSPLFRLENIAMTFHLLMKDRGMGTHAGPYHACQSIVCEQSRYAVEQLRQELRTLRRKRQEARA